MQVIVDGRVAALKKEFSFDFIAENRLFSGSDSYTFSITFPLKDCPRNIEIFGLINRPDIVAEDIVFDCEIRDKSFSRLGTLTITEISDVDVKAQFLEGRAEQNFAKDFDESFINELDLGNFPPGLPSAVPPEQAWNPAATDFQAVALPWVSADSGTPHNFAEYDVDSDAYSWSEDVNSLSWQPYLLHVVRKICEAVGYSCDLSPWEQHYYLAHLLMCNTLPPGWDITGFARALPHWSVAEFFEKLELFLRGEFDIDHRARHVAFRFSRDVLANTPPVFVENVVDEYSAAVDDEGDKCEYLEAKPFKFADQSLDVWKYMSCDWLFKTWPDSSIVRYPDLVSMYQANKSLLSYDTTGGNRRDPASNVGKLLYVAEVDMFFVLRNVSRVEKGKDVTGKYMNYIYQRSFQPLNEFGAYLPEGTDADDADEIEFVPALVDYTEEKYGFALFLPFSGYNEPASGSTFVSVSDIEDTNSEFQKTGLQSMIEAGEQDSSSEYYDCIYLGYYKGAYSRGCLPYPAASSLVFGKNGVPAYTLPAGIRINDSTDPRWSTFYNIDRKRKYSFKFISDEIPSPRALFYIRGRRYICEKITATFTEDGMSQLLKGEFWPLLDD